MTADNLFVMVRRLAALLVLALFAVACTTGVTTTTAASEASQATDGGVPATTGPPATTEAPSATTTTDIDLSSLEVSAELQSQLETLVADAQEVRGLAWLSTPNIVVVSEAELESRVRSVIEEEAEDLPADEALYKLLGLLAPDADLEGTLSDLYGEQVAGFYDGETDEIVVPARESGFSLLQQATIVHELVHALTDQHFGFEPILTAMIDESRLDQANGYRALIEGDASLAQVQWIQGLSQRELGQLIAESLEIDTSALDAAPSFLSETLFFPYDTGLAFVQELFGIGGWEAVNQAYTDFADAPASTEQVINPADYQRDLPAEVAMPDLTLAGYELEITSVWGEHGLRIILNQVVGEATTARAADGWGGDGYHQWFDGENAAFLLVYRGDTAGDLAELEDALLEFALESVPEEAFVWVDSEDGLLYFIAADVFEIGQQIRADVGLG